MKVAEGQLARLQFLARVTQKECQYLLETDQRLFAEPMTADFVQKVKADPLLAERLDAFVPMLIDTAQRLHLQIDKLAP